MMTLSMGWIKKVVLQMKGLYSKSPGEASAVDTT